MKRSQYHEKSLCTDYRSAKVFGKLFGARNLGVIIAVGEFKRSWNVSGRHVLQKLTETFDCVCISVVQTKRNSRFVAYESKGGFDSCTYSQSTEIYA